MNCYQLLNLGKQIGERQLLHYSFNFSVCLKIFVKKIFDSNFLSPREYDQSIIWPNY